MELLTAAQMRGIEQAAIGGGSVAGLELMERAGSGVVDALLAWRPAFFRAPGRAAALCGPGNNGGDGFVIARRLKEAGWEVEVFLLGDPEKLPPDAAENARRWRELGRIRPLAEAPDDLGASADLVIDALFGTGLARPLEGAAARICAALSARPAGGRAVVVGVDAPSGLCSDSGRVLGDGSAAAMVCDLTVTFHRERLGHRLDQGPDRLCGDLRVVDIGLSGAPREAARLIGPKAFDVAKRGGHKYAHGHVFVISGGAGKGGAARLAARGALRVGAGLVTVGAPPAAMAENAARLDAIMLRPIGDAEELAAALADPRLNALALGPGMGGGEGARAMVKAALTEGRRGVVLDADALSAFSDDPDSLFALSHDANAVLTPHMGEFGRLFPAIRAKLAAPSATGPAYSKADAAREAAALAGCVVLLKGPDTVVARPDGGAAVVSAAYERACPWLATAGAGDVLTGMIAGLIARGMDAGPAAEAAAWLHQEAALTFGPGLIAEDLPETLPAVFRALGL
ncbi:NAD(P)H-hydrate dehydratase [Paludibacillus litoralis]|uniref:NAD(P)H-hydrate dehydratase n=1 Tax=Paludibacillus litoralis TaxID=3133267 RepID=UPI0039B737E0